MKALDISQISFSYHSSADKLAGGTGYALHHFSMSIEQGKIHALLGPNGAGKTTLMKIITGVLRGYSGEVFVLGNKMPDNKALISIGCAPQAISLYMSLTALENLHFFGVMANLSEAQIAARSDAVLAQTGLTDHAQKIVSTYSGGMQRRLNLAVALLHSPKLLLLDEPTAGMATDQVPELITLIQEVQQSGTKSVILVEHNMNVVMSVSDRITVMHQGKVLAEGTPAEIAANHDVQTAYLGGLYDLKL